jgi:acetyltransferase-like isoleucine patch superfamily enzyme
MDRLLRVRRAGYLVFIALLNIVMKCLPTSALRCLILKATGATVGGGTYIARSVEFDFPWRLTIGKNCYISKGVYLDCRGGRITIGDSCDISREALLYTLTHDIYSVDMKVKFGQIQIEQGVWICSRCVILPGATISKGAVIAAGSVFKGGAGAYELWQGNPATMRKALPQERATMVRTGERLGA